MPSSQSRPSRDAPKAPFLRAKCRATPGCAMYGPAGPVCKGGWHAKHDWGIVCRFCCVPKAIPPSRLRRSSSLRRTPVAALTVHRTVIHSRDCASLTLYTREALVDILNHSIPSISLNYKNRYSARVSRGRFRLSLQSPVIRRSRTITRRSSASRFTGRRSFRKPPALSWQGFFGGWDLDGLGRYTGGGAGLGHTAGSGGRGGGGGAGSGTRLRWKLPSCWGT